MRNLLRLPSWLAVGVIHAYQRSLGRLVGNRCRFHPSCSEYAAIAISSNGLFRGGVQALWRLLRCGPWTAGGVDQPPLRRIDGSVARG